MKDKRTIIIAITSILIFSTAIILWMAISNDSDNKSSKEKLKSYTCGRDGDNLTIAMCNRYEEKGYIVTFKKGYDLNAKYTAVNTLLDKIPGLPVVYFEGEEMNIILREYLKTPDEKYNMDDVLYIIDYGKIEFSKIEKVINEIECLDQIYTYTGTKKKN